MNILVKKFKTFGYNLVSKKNFDCGNIIYNIYEPKRGLCPPSFYAIKESLKPPDYINTTDEEKYIITEQCMRQSCTPNCIVKNNQIIAIKQINEHDVLTCNFFHRADLFSPYYFCDVCNKPINQCDSNSC